MARIPAAERRAELVAAAVRMIAAHGVDGATTRRIAQDANAPLATLHYCFATKEVLFAAVFEHVTAQYREVLACNDVQGDVETTARAVARRDGVVPGESGFRRSDRRADQLGPAPGGQAGRDGVRRGIRDHAADPRAAATDAGQSVDPKTIAELAYIVSTLSDGFALNWLVFTDRTAAELQIELVLGVLDAWMAANVGDVPRPAAPAAKASPEDALRSLVSWVSVE